MAAVEKAGMRAYYVVLPKHDERARPLFGKNEFVYDAEKDLYVCPRGETLRRPKGSTTRRDPSGTPPGPVPATRAR